MSSSAPDFIPLNEFPSAGKRKTMTPSSEEGAEDEWEGPCKRARRGEGSSSPLSTVPSEAVPTEFAFNVLQARREALNDDNNNGSCYHAIEGLKSAIKRCEDADGLLDDDTIEFLMEKLEHNVAARRGNVGSYTEASTQTGPLPQPGPTTATVKGLWARQLEHIRRLKPIVPAHSPITVVRCQLREAKRPSGPSRDPVPFPQSSLPSPSSAPVIDLLSSSDDDDDDDKTARPGDFRVGGAEFGMYDPAQGEDNYDDSDSTQWGGVFGGTPPSLPHDEVWDRADRTDRADAEEHRIQFYGLDRSLSLPVHYNQLRYQDNRNNYTRRPDPTSGHQLNLEQYHDDMGSMHTRDVGVAITDILRNTSWGASSAELRGYGEEQQMLRWRTSPHSAKVMRGFPLVEDVRFLVAGNHGSPSGDCYWRALSFHLYGGTASHWDLVKAEHLEFVHHVLSNRDHPRYQLYSEHFNSRFFDTSAASASSTAAGGGEFKANLWQTLHMAHTWTPALMQQITADLYNICVVTFSVTRKKGPNDNDDDDDGGGFDVVVVDDDDVDENEINNDNEPIIHEVTETAMRGAYNSRHIFLAYMDSMHFQPMVPVDFYASEFQYPLPTVADTARYKFAPKVTNRNSARSSLAHPWRHEFTETAPLPVPRMHGCDVDDLRRYMGTTRQT